MSNPSDQPITARRILQINAQAAGGILALFYAWLCWQMVSPEWWGFWLVAVLSGIGGGILMIQAISQAVRAILSQRRWRVLTRQGTTPRADRQPVHDDFKDIGMIR
tara:strand:+ start:1930 stop:2247 length:318 start_codon:yes stop_codon:yes gene_type:complete